MLSDAPPQPRKGRLAWLRRPRWASLLVVVLVVAAVGSTMAVHAAQGAANAGVHSLTRARSAASRTMADAKSAGVDTTSLRQAVDESHLPGWSETALSLFLGGGSQQSQLHAQASTIEAQIAALQPKLAAWRRGMKAIELARTTARTRLNQLAHAMPKLSSLVEQHKSPLSLSGPVPTSRQAAVAAQLSSASQWAQSYLASEEQDASQITQDLALVTHAQQLNIPLGAAQQEISTAQSEVAAATTAAQLGNIQSNLNSEMLPLAVNVRAADPGPGKVIVVHLAAQTLTAYDNGKVVLTTLVTTGRPLLRTPIGIDSIHYKDSPYLFISPWPPGSPFWYPDTEVNWVMNFLAGGFDIHDAPWEPNSVYGPGSENGVDASHGCVQVPHNAMQFLWNWTPLGTTVVIAP